MKKKYVSVQVGRTVRKIREESGLSLDEMADRTNLCKNNLYRLEKGVSNPTLKTLLTVAESLGVKVKDLVVDV